jgi:hypothetical protein
MFKKSLKKFVIAVLIMSFVSATAGCGDTKRIDGITYDTYGLINKDEKRNPDIKYRLIIGNVVWSVILVETIVAPLYFIGFSMYEPVRKANPDEPKGSI